MKILPFERYTIDSSFSVEIVNAIIDQQFQVLPRFIWGAYDSPKPFWGRRKGNRFKLHRTYPRRPCYLSPVTVFGKVEPTDSGTRVTITLRPRLPGTIAMVTVPFVPFLCHVFVNHKPLPALALAIIILYMILCARMMRPSRQGFSEMKSLIQEHIIDVIRPATQDGLESMLNKVPS